MSACPDDEDLYRSSLSSHSFRVLRVSRVSNLPEAAVSKLEALLQALVHESTETELWEVPYVFARHALRAGLDAHLAREEMTAAMFIPLFDVLEDYLDSEDIEEMEASFLCLFPKTQVPAGLDSFDVATWKVAREQPTSIDGEPLRKNTRRIARLAYFRSLDYPEGFTLPQNRIGDWLGIKQRTVSTFINSLIVRGIIECVDSSYSYKGHKGKLYRFIHPA